MNLIIVGYGRVGAELAYRLYQKGHRVTVIDQTAAAFSKLHPDFRGHTVEGEVLNEGVLERAGIQNADGLAVVTNTDALNAVVAHLAQSVYHVPVVVARNYDPQLRPMIEAFGVQIVSSSSWGAQRIEEILSQAEVRTVFSAGHGEVEIYELIVPPAWDGCKLSELIAGLECQPVSITRAGRASLPGNDFILEEADLLLVSATAVGMQTLQARLVEKEG